MIEPSLELLLYAAAVVLILIGLAGLMLVRHLFRAVLALALAEAGANLLLILAGYRDQAVAPIIDPLQGVQSMVDPVPQALVLTAIVIGVGIQALALTILIRLQLAYGTLDVTRIRELLATDLAHMRGIRPSVSDQRPRGERPLGVAPAQQREGS